VLSKTKDGFMQTSPKPDIMSPTERLAEMARILSKGVARLINSRYHASKTGLLPNTRQSETCAGETGLTERVPAKGDRQKGLKKTRIAGGKA
jgi:hypothetical protein